MKGHKLTFWSGTGSVTGANFELESPEGESVLVDCGLIQGGKDEFAVNAAPFGYDASKPRALFVTHAHIDHIGRIPKLVRDGFRGEIISHHATLDLARVMFEDAVRLMETEASELGMKPYYSRSDIETAFSLWKGMPYHEAREIAGYRVTLKDAGHILGSSMVEFEKNGTKLVFTGDLGNSPSPLLCDTESVAGADLLVMESVYGDRNHQGRAERLSRLGEAILAIQKSGGALIIPAFSLERTQMIIYEINNLIEEKRVPQVPVFVDSPLASKVTDIYRRYTDLFKDSVRSEIAGGDDIFSFPGLVFTPERRDSEQIGAEPGPKVILAGSGMSVGGRVLSHEARYLSDPKSMVLLVGFQTPGSLGRALQNGVKKVRIAGRDIRVRAKIEEIRSFSSHKDSDRLVEFVEDAGESLKKVYVAMGEPKASLFLIQRLRDYAGVDAVYPERGKSYTL